MLQLTSRRFLRELDKAPGGNNLQYILKCPCIPFFGNQGLYNKIMLGGNRGRSRVMCEGSPYTASGIINVNLLRVRRLGPVECLEKNIEYTQNSI